LDRRGWKFADANVMLGAQDQAVRQSRAGELMKTCLLISFLLTLAQSPVTAQNQIVGCEIIQSIQDITNSVPLIKGKPTVIRVYVKPASPTAGLSAQLNIITPNSTVPLTTTLAFLDPNWTLSVVRNDLGKSLNFAVPQMLTNSDFTISSLTLSASGSALSCDGCNLNAPVHFVNAPPLRVKVIGFSYNIPGSNSIATPSNADFSSIQSWLKRAYPIASLVLSQITLDIADQGMSVDDLDCNTVNTVLTRIRKNEVRSGIDGHTHYYGIVPDDAGFMRGCASGIPQTPDPGTVASGPSGKPTPTLFKWDTTSSYAGWYAGHELAHTFGRFHPGFCLDNSADDNNMPPEIANAMGHLAGSDNRYVGYDSGLDGHPVTLPGTIWTDIMTYCDYEWPSSYTYQGILARLQSEGNSSQGQAPLGTHALASRPKTHKTISLIATVNMTKKKAIIRYVGRQQSTEDVVDNASGRVKIVAEDATGNTLSTLHVDVKLDTDIPAGKDQTGIIDALISDSVKIAKLVVFLGDIKIAETSTESTEQKAELSTLSAVQLSPDNRQDYYGFIKGIPDEETAEGLLLRWHDTTATGSYTVEIGLPDKPLETVATKITNKYYVVKKSVLDRYKGTTVKIVVSANNLSRTQLLTKTFAVKR
jgi:hypothetical protein